MFCLKKCMESVEPGSGSIVWMSSTLKGTLVLIFFFLSRLPLMVFQFQIRLKKPLSKKDVG